MKKLDFGFDVKQSKDSLILNFRQEIANWKRYASELIGDRVTLDFKSGKDFLIEHGDQIVYEVYNLWKSIGMFKKIYEKTGIVSDVTIINRGMFSPSDKGELFCTYGHLHETAKGEVHLILKNSCFLMLSDRKSRRTFILELKKGDLVLIHPKFMHRTISYKKDCLLVTFAPKNAGHDYLSVKGKGFPFHLFYDMRKRKLEVKRNVKYPKGKYEFVKKVPKKLDFIKLLRSNPEKIKDILDNPTKYEKLYFMGDKK
jgi:oxalate decarboxylase/phosphoglucose isomerase-like protein (cupin superfamily)